MADTPAQTQAQNEPNPGTGEAGRDRGKAGAPEARIRAAVRSGGEAGAEVARQGAKAAEDTTRSSGEALRQSGEAAARAAEQSGEAGADVLNRAGHAGAAALRKGGEMIAGTQREIAQETARQFEEFGHKMAEAARESADNLRSIMVLPSPVGSGIRDIQQAASSLVEGVVHTNLRATREWFRLANPAAVIDLQRRFVREYLGALLEGSAILVRAVHRSAEEALGPIEQQIEQARQQNGGSSREANGARKVAEVMSTDVRVANPEDTVQQATRLMRDEDTGVLPVGEGDRLVGMLTDRDVAVRLVAEGKDPAHTKVREVMTQEVRYAFEDEELDRVADNMAEQQLRRLPVVNRQKRLVGIVSLSDIGRKGQRAHQVGRALSRIATEGGQHSHAAAE